MQIQNKVLIKDVATRIGYDHHGIGIYHFHGIGYWKAPSGISIFAERGVYLRAQWKSHVNGTCTEVALHQFDKESILAGLGKLLQLAEEGGSLYNRSVRSNWIERQWPTVANTPYGATEVIVNPIRHIRDVYPRKIFIGQTKFPERLDELVEKGKALKKEMIDLFKRRHQLTAEEALVFYTANPMQERMIA